MPERPESLAEEAARLAEEQKRLMDVPVTIDHEALSRLDEMPDDEAAALIDQTMIEIFFY